MKRLRIAICLEITGALIFLAGLLYYVLFGMIPKSRSQITPDIWPKLIFHQGISVKIMTTGGIILLLGLSALLLVVFTAIYAQRQDIGSTFARLTAKRNSHLVRFIRYAMLIVPYLVIALFNYVYEPINKNITVKHFGCGCPRLDGSYGFNSNWFNAILWLPIIFFSILLWTSLAKELLPKPIRFWAMQIGIFVLVLLAHTFYCRSLWV